MSQVLQGFVRALVVSAIASAVPLFAQADNTKANAGDRAQGAVTADQQKENPTDRDSRRRFGRPWCMTRRCRRMHTT